MLEVANLLDATVIGVNLSLLGQILVATIVLSKPEAQNSVKNRLRESCLAKLSSFKVLAKVILTDEILQSTRQKNIKRV
jgi:hypothetical protein